jgi:DNA-directed RNA polymerase subunit RPC12/RpoP
MILGDPNRPPYAAQPPKPEMTPPGCAKCGKEMQLGFIADTDHHGAMAEQEWAIGRPVKGFFGVHASGRTYTVRTYRCTQCGYLESYAPSR